MLSDHSYVTKFNFPAAFLLFAVSSQSALALPNRCVDLLSGRSESRELHAGRSQSGISAKELTDEVSQKIGLVPEFQYIRGTARKMGLRVWLFGGTASGFLHYVKLDLARGKGLMDLQKDRFDYDFTNIFRSTQDLDIVVDADPEAARVFQNTIAQKFPHFLGSKANKWEVRTLRHRMGKVGELGFKEALLNDADFNNQNTDSNSIGMVEITQSKEPVVRDLKHWDQPVSVFLEDALANRISFFRSDKHFTTSRARAGENPEILSVIRLLVKAFQYELRFSEKDFGIMKSIVNNFDPGKITNQAAQRRIHDTAKKLVIHAVNIEYAMHTLDELGLRPKLISMGGKGRQDSDAWWLNKEPLRSQPVGQGQGKTAQALNIKVVAHETNSFQAYESITRSHEGTPNVLSSRQNAAFETAGYGDGFYTRLGKEGARGTGLTIRFTVDPRAREGTDFTVHGDYVVFKNKKALKVIQESLNFGIDDLLKLAQSHQELRIDHSDLALLEKLKRKLNAAKITDELDKLLNSESEEDHERLIHILSSFQNSSIKKLISKDVLGSVAGNVFGRVQALAESSSEAERMRYVKTVGPILKTIDSTGLLKSERFFDYLDRLIQTPTASSELRRQAVFELWLSAEDFEQYLGFKKYLSPAELKAVISEVRGWHESQDPRKRKFAVELNRRWAQAIESGEVKRLKALVHSRLVDINHKNVSQVSILQLAAYYQQNGIIEWLIENPKFDFNARNTLGFTEVEQLRLSGKTKLADTIEQRRPEARARPFKVKERNDDGSPIIDFVRMEPGSFMMGDGENKVLTTITKPFEIMSTQTTQETYRVVAELLKGNLRGEYSAISATPSKFKGETRPVEQVSDDDIALWNKGLNELSKRDDVQVQEALESLFPGHKKGAEYRLLTEAEWEFTARLGGVAESDYSHGKSEVGLGEYAVYNQNSGTQSQPVGTKKPVFYNGKPIYDMHGNVWIWLADWYGSGLPGGIDPQGPVSGSYRVIRGGSWNILAEYCRSAYRGSLGPANRHSYVGFRLVRTAE